MISNNNKTKPITISELHFLRKLPTWKELKVEALRLGLDCGEVFKLDDETIEKEFNYIGPDRFPEWIRIVLSKLHSEVLPAVLIHDLDYFIGGTKDEFYKANLRMKNNMIKCIRANRSKFSLIGYWLARKRIKAAWKLCDKYGLVGWNLKEGE